MAFEDAYMLSGLLGSLGKGDNFGLAFKAFDEVGRSRARKLGKTSRSAGLVHGFSDECIWENLEQFKDEHGDQMELGMERRPPR